MKPFVGDRKFTEVLVPFFSSLNSKPFFETAKIHAPPHHMCEDVTAIFRADFFVRWERDGQPAALWINEVEHGFNAACLFGWFGQDLTALALS